MKKQITVYLSPALVRDIDKDAKRQKRTRTAQVEFVLAAHYNKKEKA